MVDPSCCPARTTGRVKKIRAHTGRCRLDAPLEHPAGELTARYVVQRGADWQDGYSGEAELLQSCYRGSLLWRSNWLLPV